MDTSRISADAFAGVFGIQPDMSSDLAGVSLGVGTGGESMLPLRVFVSSLERERLSSSDAMGSWRRGERLEPGRLGTLGQMIDRCSTFGDAVRTLAHGFPLLQSNTEVSFRVGDDSACFSYRLLDSRIWPRRADAELTLGLIVGIGERYGVPREAIRAVSFEHQADGEARTMSAHLGLVPRYTQEANIIVFPSRVLSARRSGGCDGALDHGSIVRSIEGALAELRRGMPVSYRVREQLFKLIGRERISQDRIARELGMSERSLRRALAAEGCSFQELLDECRRAQGFALLVRSRKPMSEIAFLLGYSDQTAFSRALSRLFGLRPKDLRKAGAEEESVIR